MCVVKLKYLCLINHRTMRQTSEWSQSSTQSWFQYWKGWIISFAPRLFCLQEIVPYRCWIVFWMAFMGGLNSILDGLHERSERFGEGFIAPTLNRNLILCLSSPLDSHRINWAISVPVVYEGQLSVANGNDVLPNGLYYVPPLKLRSYVWIPLGAWICVCPLAV